MEALQQLEEAATESDRIAGISTSCVAVADDVAPSNTANHPRDALHGMQLLLNIVEDNGKQLHMQFGKEKCKLLISGRPQKVKRVENLLKEEPELLTFLLNDSSVKYIVYQPIFTIRRPHITDLIWWF